MLDDKIAHQIIVGSLCGDSSIFMKKGCVNPIYKESHCEAQIDYNIWKFVTLSSVLKLKHYYFRTKHGIISSFYSSADFRLFYYRDMFYTNGNRKYITRKCLDMLNPLGLSVFYQDDGSYDFGSRMVTISACVNHKSVQETICKYFKEVWGLNANIRKSSGGFVSSFDVKSSDKFLKIVEPYIHNCLRYKLGHLEPSNKQLFIDARKKKTVTQKKSRSTTTGKEQMAGYNAKYVERIKDWNVQNKEHRRKYMVSYYEVNKEKMKERSRLWRLKNKNGDVI